MILNPAAIILFGSYVNGTPHDDSNIGIAVVFNGFSGNDKKPLPICDSSHGTSTVDRTYSA